MPSYIKSPHHLKGLLRLSTLTVLLLLPHHPSSETPHAISSLSKAESLNPCRGAQYLILIVPRSHLLPSQKRPNITRNRIVPATLLYHKNTWHSLPLDYVGLVQAVGEKCDGWVRDWALQFSSRNDWNPSEGSVMLLMPKGLFSLRAMPTVWENVRWVTHGRELTIVDCSVDRDLSHLCGDQGALVVVNGDALRRWPLQNGLNKYELIKWLYGKRGQYIDSRDEMPWDVKLVHFPQEWENHLSNICIANPGLISDEFEFYVVAYANWCGFCQAVLPRLRATAKRLPQNIKMTFVNDELVQLGALDALVTGLPTVIRVVWKGAIASVAEVTVSDVIQRFGSSIGHG